MVGAGIDRYYASGRESSIIVALSMSRCAQLSSASGCLADRAKAVTKVGVGGGMTNDEAEAVAVDTAAQIEGSVVLAAISGERRPFERAMDSLPDVLVPIKA